LIDNQIEKPLLGSLGPDKINDLKVNINVKGDNLLSLNMVLDEIKHIFSKLINKSLENFKSNKSLEKKFINISFDDAQNSIFITYEDNAKIYDENQIENFFNVTNSIKQENFDLGFYLVKIFVEKNFGLLMIKKTDDGIKYIIRFDK
jgi:sensor histidine kinase regulating citrate/malate metabolism